MTDSPIRFACVPYLNARPLCCSLEGLLPEAKISYLPPTGVAKALATKRADVGLVPAFSLLESGLKDCIALADIGIACRGEVLSVYVGAKSPLDQLTEIYLDPESRTSNALTRILAPVYFSTRMKFLATFPGYEKEINGPRAGLVIGDRALQYRENLPYRLDLGKAWLDYTALPFVFALWAIRKEVISEALVQVLQEAARLGTQKMEEIAAAWSEEHKMPSILATRYLNEHMIYHLGSDEHQGLKHFVQTAIAIHLIRPEREVRFYDTHAHYRQSPSRKEPHAG